MFGSGISPGYVNLLAVVAAAMCDRVDKITIDESADTTFYDSPATEKPVGFGRPIDDPDLQAMTAEGTAVFAEAVRMVADSLGSNSTRCVAMPSTPKPPRTSTSGRGPSPAGCVAGVYASWKGIVEGETVVEINVRWRKGQSLEPDWKIDGDGWEIDVAGRPTVTMNVGFLPPPDFEATTMEEFMVLGYIMTAIPPSTRFPRWSPPHRASSPTTTCPDPAPRSGAQRETLTWA